MANEIKSNLKIKLEFETDKWKQQVKGAAGELNKLNGRVSTTDKSLQRATKSANQFGDAMKYVWGYIGFQGVKAVFNNALAFDRVNNRMRAATESLEEYNQATRVARDLSQQLGVDLLSASRGYATLIAATRGSKLEGAGTEELFESILKTSSALSLTADETNSVILAFSQVASKGKAAAEEIRGQIGERIPGYFLKLADAIGVTQKELSKMLDDGLLDAETALIASTKAMQDGFGEGSTRNLKSLTAEFSRLVNNIKTAGKVLADSEFLSFILRSAGGVLRIGSEERKNLETTKENNDELIKRARLELGRLETLRQLNKLSSEEVDFRINDELRELQAQFDKINATDNQIVDVNELIKAEKSLNDLTILSGEYLKNLNAINSANQTALDEEYQEILNLKAIEDSYKLIGEQAAEALAEALEKAKAEALINEINNEIDEGEKKRNKERDQAIKEQQARVDEINKKVEDARADIGFSPQEANEVSFLSSVVGGSADDQRQNRLARSRELGATKGDVDLAVQRNRKLDLLLEAQKQENSILRDIQKDKK